MLSLLLTIVIAMLVYIFWFLKLEFHRVIDRIDQASVGIARMNRELMQATAQMFMEPRYRESMEEEEADGAGVGGGL